MTKIKSLFKGNWFLKLAFWVGILYIGIATGNLVNNAFQDYYANRIDANEYVGLPAYTGKCTDMVKIAYEAYAADRTLNDNLPKDMNVAKAYYDKQVTGNFNVAFSRAIYCEDKDAVSMLLYLRANAIIDASILHIRTKELASNDAQSLYNQIAANGYFTTHELQANWLQYRIDRTRAKLVTPSP
jgi:hypothetical protein